MQSEAEQEARDDLVPSMERGLRMVLRGSFRASLLGIVTAEHATAVTSTDELVLISTGSLSRMLKHKECPSVLINWSSSVLDAYQGC